jgi:hypothetical protein
MDPNSLMLSQDEFNAHALRGVMGATGQPGETAPDAQTRCAAIVAIFRTFEAANPMEAMIACHCISLRFMLAAAMHDAGAPDLAPAMLIRMRASVLAIGKSLHLWMAEFAGLHARNEARAAEAEHAVSQPGPEAMPAKPQSAGKLPPAPPGEPRPVAAAPPVKSTPPSVAPAGLVRSGLEPADTPAQGMKQALLSSAALARRAASNGRLTAATSPPGR